MNKESYTKSELKFIDNCAHSLSTANVFDNNTGHVLTIDVDKYDMSVQLCKDNLFRLNLDEFDTIRRQYDELLNVSIIVKQKYIKLMDTFNSLWNYNEVK